MDWSVAQAVESTYFVSMKPEFIESTYFVSMKPEFTC
jgi:hypothetical protein